MPGANVKRGLILAIICVTAFIWPVTALVNRIEPMVLGMPFFMFWHVLWVFITIGVLAFLNWVLKI
ncbi:MAG: DUF3311 domain-containing protein [candidate division NC10 bacterium]|nr:DUF3311 domain-containing protein [candidate division NC10 bacterium]